MFNSSSTTSSSPGVTTPPSEQQTGSSGGGSRSPPVPPPYQMYLAASTDTVVGASSSVSNTSLPLVSAPPHQFAQFVTGSHVVLTQHAHPQVQLVSYGHPALSVVTTPPTAYGFHTLDAVSYASSAAQAVVLISSGTSMSPSSPQLALAHVAPGSGQVPQFLVTEPYHHPQQQHPHHQHHRRTTHYPQPHASPVPFPTQFYVAVDTTEHGATDQGHSPLPAATPGTEKNAHGLVVGQTYEGTIKRYNPWRGFGFVRTDSGVDIFLHHSGVVGDTTRIVVGLRARFEVALVGGHRQAVKLQLLPPRKVE